MLETVEHERHINTYDYCRMPPAVAALRHGDAERDDAGKYKMIDRLLKAWRESTKPARKRHRPPLRKRRTVHRWYGLQTPQGEISYKIYTLSHAKPWSKHLHPELELRTIFDRLSALKRINDVADEYTFRPTERAYINTKLTILRTYQRMGERFPKPRIVPDGEGGIVATWRQNGRSVRLRFQEKADYKDYIYYQSDGEYDVEAATVENLTKRLEWLNSA